MGNAADSPVPDRAVFDPHATPLRRRTVLVLMGAGAVAATGGLAMVLEGCSVPPVTVTLDVDPASLVVGTPTEVSFPLALGDRTVEASTWLVKQASGHIIAFDPRCTHALCAYTWAADLGRFQCPCHDGRFALDGAVLAGPPPRALDRFPVRETATGIEVDVPGSFATPKESLG